jgi:small subunit ribosomal protein S20
MPLRHKSAQKRARQTVKRAERNKFYKAKIRTAVKNVLSAKDKETALSQLNTAVSMLDKVSNKGIMHKNAAANKKSRLSRHVNKMK